MDKIKSFGQSLVKDLREIRLANIIMLVIAGCINAVGVTLFLTPLRLIDGGFSGFAYILSQVSPEILSLSFYLIVLNFPIFIFAFKKLGISFIVYSLISITCYSVMAYLIQHVFPIDVTNGSPIAQNDVLLCAIFGGLISGLGSGLTIRFGGAIDGVEVLAVIFARYIGMTVGTFVMCFNVISYAIAGVLFGNWILPLYSILAYAVGVKIVDFVVEGFDKGKCAMIITNRSNELASAISKTFGQGVTLFDAKGYYSKVRKTVIYVVVNRFQIGKLRKVVSDIDKDAFVTITEVSETFGAKKLKSNTLSVNDKIKRKIARYKVKDAIPKSPPELVTFDSEELEIGRHDDITPDSN